MPKLYRTEIAFEADLTVHITNIRPDAHLVAYLTNDAWMATSAPIWYYTDVLGEADKTIYLSDTQWDADLVVFFTDIQSDAGWQDTSKTDRL